MLGFKNFLMEEDGMGTVEIVLIIVVLIALVTLFSGKIKDTIETILDNINTSATSVS